MMWSRSIYRAQSDYFGWLCSSNTRRFVALGCLAGIMALSRPSSAEDEIERRKPKGGSAVTKRACSNSPDPADPVLCTSDSNCNLGGTTGTCGLFNIIHLTVNLRAGTSGWIPSAAQIQEIQRLFSNDDDTGDIGDINDAIYAATDGQFVLGTVSLVTNNQEPGAVVQLFAGECTGSGDPCMQNSDCGAAGPCVLSDVNAPERGNRVPPGGWGTTGPMEVRIDCIQDPLCFAHQFIHYIGSVHDENEGSLECEGPQSSTVCVGGSRDGEYCYDTSTCEDNEGMCELVSCIAGTSSGCLMQFPQENTGVELCTQANHESDGDTEQSRCHNHSCWTQLASQWPSVVLAPAGLPIPGPFDPPPMDFVQPAVAKRVVVVIDRSGSMVTPSEDPTRIERAVNAVQDFVDLLSNGTQFALVSFADASTKDFPEEDGLRTIDSVVDRGFARTAAGELLGRVDGFTNIGAGLRHARDILLQAGGEITLNSRVILLTDGLNNEPWPNPQADLSAALAELSAARLEVNVTCIGSEVRDSTQCVNIADVTGGQFVDSQIEANLYDAFVEFVAEVEGSGMLLLRENIPITQGGSSGDIEVEVEPGVRQARFVVSWTQPTNDLDLQLIRPDGTAVTTAPASGTQGTFYRIDTPESGTWRMRVQGTAVAGTEHFSARVLLDNQELSFNAAITRSVITWPEEFLINAYPSFGRGIAGCEVQATVQKPDGTFEEVELRDEGATGDGNANDGLYAFPYRNFTGGDGLYTFLVRARCEQGAAQTIDPREPGSDALAFTPVVPTFERTLRFSGMVRGVPDNLPPVAEICSNEQVECEGLMTPVTLDGTCSFDPDGDPDGYTLSYRWSSPTGTFDNNTVAMPTGFFPLGRNDVELEVTDAEGATSEPDTGFVLVADTAAPVIHGVTATPDYLWSPDHGMVPVTLAVDVTDACDPDAACEITSVTSDEPDDGSGDGSTEPDWEITGPLSLNLRSERAGGGDGRAYTIEVICSDHLGYSVSAAVPVTVSHSQGN